MAAYGAEQKHVDLADGLPLTAREQPFAVRTFDGKVCPKAADSASAEPGNRGAFRGGICRRLRRLPHCIYVASGASSASALAAARRISRTMGMHINSKKPPSTTKLAVTLHQSAIAPITGGMTIEDSRFIVC